MAIERISNAFKSVAKVLKDSMDPNEAGLAAMMYALPPISLIASILGFTSCKEESKVSSIPVVKLTQIPTPDQAIRQRDNYSQTRQKLNIALSKLSSAANRVANLKHSLKSLENDRLRIAGSDISADEKASKIGAIEEKSTAFASLLNDAQKSCDAAQAEVQTLSASLRSEARSD